MKSLDRLYFLHFFFLLRINSLCPFYTQTLVHPPRSSQTSEREKFDEKLPRVEKSVTKKHRRCVCQRSQNRGCLLCRRGTGPGHSLDEQEQRRELMENVSDIKRKRACCVPEKVSVLVYLEEELICCLSMFICLSICVSTYYYLSIDYHLSIHLAS